MGLFSFNSSRGVEILFLIFPTDFFLWTQNIKFPQSSGKESFCRNSAPPSILSGVPLIIRALTIPWSKLAHPYPSAIVRLNFAYFPKLIIFLLLLISPHFIECLIYYFLFSSYFCSYRLISLCKYWWYLGVGWKETEVRYDSIIFTHALSHLFSGLTYLPIADKEKTLCITQLYPIPYTSQIREQIVNSSPKLYLSDSFIQIF